MDTDLSLAQGGGGGIENRGGNHVNVYANTLRVTNIQSLKGCLEWFSSIVSMLYFHLIGSSNSCSSYEQILDFNHMKV